MGEEFISDLFDIQGFAVVEDGGILIFKPVGFDLEGIRIDLLLPEPVRRTQLDILRVHERDIFQGFQESFSRMVILKAKGDVGDSVCHFGNIIPFRQGIKVIRIIPARIYEMSVAALKGEAVRQAVKAVDDFDDGRVDHIIGEAREGFLFLFMIMRVRHQFFWRGEGLQAVSPFLFWRIIL